MAQPTTIERPPAIKLAVTLPRCDACGDDASPYPDLAALVLCPACAAHLDRERRIASGGSRGPMPRLTPFRLGVLSGAFVCYPRLVAKLERLAEAA